MPHTFLLIVFFCASLMGGVEVNYVFYPAPSELGSIRYFNATATGTGWVIGRYTNGANWFGVFQDGQLVRIDSTGISTLDLDRPILSKEGHLTQGSFEVRDESPEVIVGGFIELNNPIKGKSYIKTVLEKTAKGLEFLCGDGAVSGMLIDGNAYQLVYLTGGPNWSVDGRKLFSAFRLDGEGKSIYGVYESVLVKLNGLGSCMLKTVFETDPRYDILSIWGEESGTYIAHRWLRNQAAANRNTEVVRLAADGKLMSVLLVNSLECCSRIVASPTSRNTSWGDRDKNFKYRLWVTQPDGSPKELLATERYVEPAFVLDDKYVLAVTGLAAGLPDTLLLINTVTGEQVVTAKSGPLGKTGFTVGVGSINSSRAWIHPNGKVYFCLEGVSGIFEATLIVVPDPPPPPPLPTPSAVFSADEVVVTVGKSVKLTWQTSNAVWVMLNGDKLSSVSGSLEVSPLTTTTYTLVAVGPGGSVTRTLTVVVNSGLPDPRQRRPFRILRTAPLPGRRGK